MSENNSFKPSFFVIPARIMDLPNITLHHIRFYETIFQFLNRGKNCYLSNSMLKERTGIKSAATIQECFEFFEKHKELERVFIEGGRRYIVQPQRMIEIGDNDAQPLSLQRDPPSRHSETPPLATARHKNNKFNKKNINKDYAHFEEGAEDTERASHSIKKKNNTCALRIAHFEEFWETYPKKKDKKRTEAIWIKNHLDEKADLILSKLKTQVRDDVQWRNKQFILNPSTYLHGERWNDEITVLLIPKYAPSVKVEYQNDSRRPQLVDWTQERLDREAKERSHGSEVFQDNAGRGDLPKTAGDILSRAILGNVPSGGGG